MDIQIIHDGSFDIATGRSRKETSWKNKEMLWSDLVKKLSETHRTAETHAEYMIAKKPRQDEIKDVGGFCGGYLTGGRRKASSIQHRQLITLDLDFAKPGLWDDLQMLYGNAALIYSTHKHSPEHPRLRLIMPLSRAVRPDEYEAIARRIAGILDIELFDPTTFQPERLMYWPSTSKDAEFEFQYQDGEWLNADEILGSYRDWSDSSEWPVSDRVDKILKRNMQKQGDPLEKPGVIGAFCRTYSIDEVIETYLQDVYDSCEVDNRYSYKEGSTAAGLIVYDGKYAYSHHGTDPTSGKLCNAFDLVRIHKFGLKDEDVREGAKGNRLPSYQCMIDLIAKDIKAKKTIAIEKLEGAKNDFGDIPEDEIEDSAEWMAELEADRANNYLTNVLNLQTILEKDVRLKNKIAYNEFSYRKEVLKPLPWDREAFTKPREWGDDDLANMRCYLGLPPYGLKRTPMLEDSITVVKRTNSYHPVRDYLNSIHWDVKPRLETILIDYLGAEDTPYVRAVTVKTLVAAVARVFMPGCKFDYVLTLVGKQGVGKSTLIRKLGKDWYTDTFNFGMLSGSNGKMAFEQLLGKWIIEIGEMVGLKKADVEAAKNFLSSGTDTYRPSHKEETVSRQRQSVFIGTTNGRKFLMEAGGNRRFWPVDVGVHDSKNNIWIDLTDNEIDQIWAEAVIFHKAGEELYLSKELEEYAGKVQEDHEEEDDRTGVVEKYLSVLLPTNWDDLNIYERREYLQGDEVQEKGKIKRNVVCVAEIWCEALGGLQKDMTTNNTKYLHVILRKIKGWQENKNLRSFGIYGRQKGYERINKKIPETSISERSGTKLKNLLEPGLN